MLVARRFLPGDGGHPPLEGIGGGAVPVVNGPGIALAALGTLSFGAVLGPEAPLIALGAVVGGVVTLFASVDEKGEGVLATAGSFSAISALFGGPIVGGMMMVEGGLGMGSALLPILLPGFVAAAIGYVLFIGLGDWGGLSAQGLAVPSLPPYTGTHIYDLIVGVAVGVVAAVIVAVVRRAAGELTREGHDASECPCSSSAVDLQSAWSHRSPTGSERTRRTCCSPARPECPTRRPPRRRSW